MKRTDFDLTLSYIFNQKESMALKTLSKLSSPGDYDWLLFRAAAKHGHISIIEWFLQNTKVNVAVKNNEPISNAIKEGQYEVVKSLINLPGVVINFRDILICVEKSYYKLTELLLLTQINNLSIKDFRLIKKKVYGDMMMKIIEKVFVTKKRRDFVKKEYLVKVGLCHDVVTKIMSI